MVVQNGSLNVKKVPLNSDCATILINKGVVGFRSDNEGKRLIAGLRLANNQKNWIVGTVEFQSANYYCKYRLLEFDREALLIVYCWIPTGERS